jgi:hypothetical protein
LPAGRFVQEDESTPEQEARMPQYMLLLGMPKDDSRSPEERQAEFPQWFDYTQALQQAGVMVAGDPLEPTESATTVRVRAGETLVTDGPFIETKEWLGGYYIIDVPDLDAALEWAAKVPNAPYGSVEVRPIMVIEACRRPARPRLRPRPAEHAQRPLARAGQPKPLNPGRVLLPSADGAQRDERPQGVAEQPRGLRERPRARHPGDRAGVRRLRQ